MIHSQSLGFRLKLLGILASLAVAYCPLNGAAQSTWTGNGLFNSTDPVDWSNPSNWASSSVPLSGLTSITFATAPTGVSTNNLGTFKVSQLVFNTPVILSGNQLTLQSYQFFGTYGPSINQGSAGPVVIQNNLLLNYSDFYVLGTGTGNLMLSGPISGAGALEISAPSFLTVLNNASNNYSGGTIIGSGSLRTDVAGALPVGRGVSNVSGTLDLNGTNQSIGYLYMSAAQAGSPGPVVQTGGGTLTLGGDVSYNSLPSGVGAASVSGSLNLGASTRLFDIGVTGSAVDTTISAAISGIGGLTKTGAGLLSLSSGANGYVGGTIVQNGTLRTNFVGDLPAGRDVSVQSGTLDLFGTNQSIGNLNLSSPTATITSPAPVVQLDGGSLTLGGNVTYHPGDTVPAASISSGILNLGATTRTFDIGYGGMVYSVVASAGITGGGGLTKTGSGNLVLTGGTYYSGTTTVNAGALTLGVANALSTAVVVNGGYLILDPSSTTLGVTAGNYNQAIGSLAGTGGIVALGSATLTVGFDNTDTTYSGQLYSAGGTLVKVGAGTFTPTSNNFNFYGSITVNGGVLAVNADYSLGALNSTLTVNPAGTLRYTTSDTSTRTFNLSGGTLEAPAGVTLTLNGAGVNGGFLRGAGTFALTGGATLSGSTTFGGSTLNQSGSAKMTNFTNGGKLTNMAGQALTWNGGANSSTGEITINGSANVSNWSSNGVVTVNGGGAINNTGSNLVLGGGSRMIINSLAVLSTASGMTIELNGGLLVNNGTISGTTDVNYGSLAKGTGTYGVVNVNQGGIYAPGNSPGIVTAAAVHFDNTPFNSGAPALQIELAGTTPGTQYDQLHVTGQLSLGGVLQVALVGSFAPTAGNSFDILDWGSLSGTFSSIVLPVLGGGLGWNTSQLYTSGIVSVISTGVSGDYNGNGVVDAADYVVWRKNKGLSTALPNDPIGGTIGTAQYSQWRSHFGQSAGSGSSAIANAAVPEPSTLLLLMCTTAGWCFRQGRSA